MPDLPLARRENSDQNWIVVANTLSEPEAAIIAGRLQSMGIPVYIHREVGGATFGFTIGPLAGVKVLVPEFYYDLAMVALEPDDSFSLLEDGEEDDDLDDADDFEDDDEWDTD